MRKDNRGRVLLTAVAAASLIAGMGTTGSALARELNSVLSGKDLAGGDQDGWGRVKVHIDDRTNRLCTDLEVRSIGKVTAAQIHRGKAGQDGPAVVTLDRPEDEQDSDDCDSIGDELADQIQANPADFYVSVRTTENPNGALRGQLAPL
jgi:hypothetical protein